MFKLKFLISIFTILFFSVSCVTTSASDNFNLTILHTNDVHARLLPINSDDQTCNEQEIKQKQCFGGVARRFVKINEIRKSKPNVLLVDAGDQFQGTLFYTKNKGEEAQKFMNKLGYEAMAVGNHEFDDGPSVLSQFIKGANFPVLSANIDASLNPELSNLLKSEYVITIGNEKIGIIGCTTVDTKAISFPGESIKFLPIEAEITKSIKRLKADGVNKIILLSHGGFNLDLDIAKNVAGIDVIVAGHTNTFLSNVDKKATGPYPVVVISPSLHPVLIVSAYAYGKYLGNLDVEFDRRGRIVKWQGEPILLDHTVNSDLEIEKEIIAYSEHLIKFGQEVVGNLPENLSGGSSECRFKECKLGDVLADAILELTKPYGAEAVLINGGTVRAGLPKGNVTRWQAIDALPFLNLIAVTDLTGETLWQSIDYCVGHLANFERTGAACFPQVSGMRYTISLRKNNRYGLDSLTLVNKKGGYDAVVKTKTYRIGTSKYLLFGGDNYDFFKAKTWNHEILSETLDEALINYFKNTKQKKYQNLLSRIKIN